ncbi:hypothetical protein PAXRUDRAFT_28607 [Paxillus rubicundulus Ve08.2h10]|uniref:Uncharacterized protein n=1 Tax=Paxillus rubicundulus Ve08.2h10 TaxID=930991 RepID=A0A0D0D4G2_9AGAM|nr:hypothetical protein PAXRUDRAFT_28607 [Paxillus rubicundulus Ve08.2h10]
MARVDTPDKGPKEGMLWNLVDTPWIRKKELGDNATSHLSCNRNETQPRSFALRVRNLLQLPGGIPVLLTCQGAFVSHCVFHAGSDGFTLQTSKTRRGVDLSDRSGLKHGQRVYTDANDDGRASKRNYEDTGSEKNPERSSMDIQVVDSEAD